MVIIVGSVREGRFAPVVASWVADQAREHGGFDIDVVDLADAEIPLSLPAVSPKFVAFVSYGGPAGGRHAVLHLENVLTELHAVTIRDGLAFPNYFTAWEDGRPLDPEAPGYAKTLLDQLAWWAAALSAARNSVPYPA
ncbi:NAD(P)H-dependent oxidoreductase [Micromonospora sp. 4G57]|uniref:NAD(P)H-dependent oxidoreductase n=1 Tax=Micromonospora sicca TaxID=2202420 RepID=A0ABU5J6M1_9ACTN|nr:MULTISPECIES: NAD(P)H-dependent oxidoreductase [unclassified Micromonospora]MDZ5443058.1 NAD(P)H-dependent oxidoreductase [Micromonospora sp. 4G57]MDZ5488230.1 NAD(P)H-dependent oxidoreductase [Micromonospora sp. 4G53]